MQDRHVGTTSGEPSWAGRLTAVVNKGVRVYVPNDSRAEPRHMTAASSTPEQMRDGSKIKFALTLSVHQFVGTIGVMLLAGFLTGTALELPHLWGRDLNVFRVMTATPYYLVELVVAFLFGWLVSDIFRHDSMLWIWVLPYAWLIYEFVRLPTVVGAPFQFRFSYFFGWGCRPENRCFDQIGATLPFYVAVAYSVGALLARKMPLRSLAAKTKISTAIFSLGVIILADEVRVFAFHLTGLLAMVPQGWGSGWRWILLLIVGTLVAGIGACLIFFASKMKRNHQDLTARDPA